MADMIPMHASPFRTTVYFTGRALLAALLVLIFFGTLLAQESNQFDRQDTLRGSVTPERAWWDLTYYHLDIKVDPETKSLVGTNTIQYRVLEPGERMQIDLQPPMTIDQVRQGGKKLKVEQDGNAWYVTLKGKQKEGQVNEVVVQYSGRPKVSRQPPWDGGFTWTEDDNGHTFAATSCQGDGASLWWPCKDHMYDEPDSMLMSINVPLEVMNVSNGRLRGVDTLDNGTHTTHWFVQNPINNYGVNVNIGDYVHFGEVYEGENGPLDCDYWVLRDNEEKAREQFKQVPMMLEAFEYWFGPYPFYEDGFKLVEVPYLGMEHQSSVTYGNKYMNGYLGNDLSRTGWGLKFDFIIIHEAGHEWFANNITYKDIADMWVHEGFTAYSESLYLDYHFGKKAASEYIIGTRGNIRNDKPIIGQYGVNNRGSGDMYPKGANMLHTLRTWINDDGKWRSILRGLNEEFYHQTVTTKQVEDYMAEKSGLDLDAFFDQYLRTADIPVLEYAFTDEGLRYRWANVIAGFVMPIRLWKNEKEVWLYPTESWQAAQSLSNEDDLQIDPNFYVDKQYIDRD